MGERVMAVSFRGTATVQEKGVGGCWAVCLLCQGQGGGRKEAEIWAAGRGYWPFAPCSGVPREWGAKQEVH